MVRGLLLMYMGGGLDPPSHCLSIGTSRSASQCEPDCDT